MRVVGLGHGFFAFAAASLAILSLTFGEFAPMGQSFPGWIPWRETWVYLSALLLLAASAGLCFSRTALPSALTIGAYQAVWAMTWRTPNPLRTAEHWRVVRILRSNDIACRRMDPLRHVATAVARIGDTNRRRARRARGTGFVWPHLCLLRMRRTLSTPITPPAWCLPGYPIDWDSPTSRGLATLLLELASSSGFFPVWRPLSKRS